jgi:hypothetical protein
MHGELDRQTVLAMRAEPARDPLRSSLPRLCRLPGPDGAGDAHAVPFAVDQVTELTAPVGRAPTTAVELTAWGRRLIQVLLAQGLIELGRGPGIDEISYQLSGLLQAHGEEAEHALDTAEWLANEMGSIRGIAKLFATAGDLQIALRRSQSSG